MCHVAFAGIYFNCIRGVPRVVYCVWKPELEKGKTTAFT